MGVRLPAVVRRVAIVAAGAGAFGLASGTEAATVSLERFETTTSVAAARAFGADYAARNAAIAGAGFESPVPPAPGATSGASVTTEAGVFSGLGGAGSGGSALAPFDEIKVRSGAVSGRRNITDGGSNWLDSNDTLGISWVVDATALDLAKGFRSLSFFLTDAADTGATMTISAGDSANALTVVRTIARNAQPNGMINFIALAFDETVRFARIDIRNSGLNDGFGIDEARIHFAPIPAPAAFGLLAAAVAGLGLLARRRRTGRG
jgi:hypothetical protein